jgi:cobalt-zinc-cadmium efflux system membrane fusion protein
MRKYLPILITLIFLLAGCQSETNNTNTPEVGTPPSLQKDNLAENLIQLSDKEIEELHIETETVSSEVSNFKIVAPGMIQPHPEHSSIISAPIEGRVANILVFEGDFVRKGQIILQMESLTFGTLVAEYVQAKSEEKFQQSTLDRMEKLVEKNINSTSDLEKARSDYQRSVASVNAAYSKLKAIGVADGDIEKMQPDKRIKPLLNIYAPISGHVDQRKIEKGEAVNAYEMLMRIINPKHVMARAYLSPEDGQFLKKGDKATIMRRDMEQSQIVGKIASINPGLDESNRSIVVNIPLKVDGSWPFPGSSARIEIETKTPVPVIMVPMSAVTYDGENPIVFVKHSDSKYEKRVLEISQLKEKYAIVQNGLKSGESVAVTQIFTLKALSRYEKFAE